MTHLDLATLRRYRLHATGLWPHPNLVLPHDALGIIKHQGLIQAQEWPMASLALQVRGATHKDLMDQIDRGEIIRTWPMRGTVHLLTPQTLDWISPLLWPRTESSAQSRLNDLGLTPQIIARAKKIAKKNLINPTSPQDLRKLWADAGLLNPKERYYHLLWLFSGRGEIVRGPRTGNKRDEQALVLRSHWGGLPPKVTEPERELVHSHLRARGPASIRDIAYWAGTSQATVKIGIAKLEAEGALQKVTWPGDSGYMLEEHHAAFQEVVPWPGGMICLPPFDEILMLSKDRTWLCGKEKIESVYQRGVAVWSIINETGIVGTWDRESAHLQITNAPLKKEAEAARQLALKRLDL